MTNQRNERRLATKEERRQATVALLSGPGLRLMLLAVGSLALGALIAIAARGFVLTNELIGYVLVGLLLLAPLPMLAGDATDAILVAAAQRRWLSVEDYHRAASWAVPSVLVVVGLAIYPVVLAVGGVSLLGIVLIIGALVVFGVLPVGGWLLGKLRRRREES